MTALLGSDFALDADGDIPQMLARNGAALRQLPDCRTFDDYLSMGEAGLLLAVCPAAKYGAEMLSQRLDRPLLYLPASFSYAELTEQRRALCAALHIPFVSPDVEIADCEATLDAAGREIGQTPVQIDYTAHPRPLGLARLLLTHGFRVERVFLERVSPEEAEDFRALQRTAPSLCLTSTVRPEARVRARFHGKNAGHRAESRMVCGYAAFCQSGRGRRTAWLLRCEAHGGAAAGRIPHGTGHAGHRAAQGIGV